jgi:hypothetical protein
VRDALSIAGIAFHVVLDKSEGLSQSRVLSATPGYGKFSLSSDFPFLVDWTKLRRLTDNAR